MIAGLPFFIIGFGELWLSANVPVYAAVPLAWAGFATSWVGVAYTVRKPAWLGKHHPAGIGILPFSLFARGVAAVTQRLGLRERVEIIPGLWVGGWPRRGAPELAQLDLTAELPRRGEALRYACVAMLDGAQADDSTYETAVETALAWRREGIPVLIHCAYGHGRSVAVLIGVMVREGSAADWKEAHAKVLSVRPGARMTPGQRVMVARLARGPTGARGT